MPTNKKKSGSAKKIKAKVLLTHVDCERLFDTLFEYIRSSTDIRRELSHRAHTEYETNGPGLFVVDCFDPETNFKMMRTDVLLLHSKLEWWNHERCMREPLPSYREDDPVEYNPEFRQRIKIHSPPRGEMIIAMTFRNNEIHYGTTVNTLAVYRQGIAQQVFIPNPRGMVDFNPYRQDEVGTPTIFTSHQCCAEGCEAVSAEAKGKIVKEDLIKVKVENPNGKPLLKCSQCQRVAYCSKECQRKDWKARHKNECGKA